MGDRPHQPVLECLPWPTSQLLLLRRRRNQFGQVQWSGRRRTVAGRLLNADDRSTGRTRLPSRPRRPSGAAGASRCSRPRASNFARHGSFVEASGSWIVPRKRRQRRALPRGCGASWGLTHSRYGSPTLCTQEVSGSIPLGSTNKRPGNWQNCLTV